MTARLSLLGLLLVALGAGFSAPVPNVHANPVSGYVDVAAGGGHTCALTTGGGVKCWGLNDVGQLGDGTNIDSSNPVDVDGLASGVTAIASGWRHNCALTSGGGVKCWGNNSAGELGDGTTTNSSTPVDVSGLTSGVAGVAAGGEPVVSSGHSCAVTTGGGAKCWGRNDGGQVGNGTTTSTTTPVDVTGLASGVAAIGAAGVNTCALTTGGGVKCWGLNNIGTLGTGTNSGPESCLSFIFNLACSTTPVDVTGLGSGVGGLSVGGGHVCVVMTAGDAKCWGWNVYGQLGSGSSSGPDSCDFGYPCSTSPVDVFGLGPGLTDVVAGDYGHTCAITSGDASCWGWNHLAQLGTGSDMGPETCEYTQQEECSASPVGVAGLASGTSALSAGEHHTCAVLSPGGEVQCWGSNWYGQLGNGTTNHGSSVPYNVSSKPAPDSDGDGCSDPDEQQNLRNSETSGGRRDEANPHDYFNPSHDGENRVDDILLVIDQYFIDSGNPNYNPDTDRTLVGPLAWNLGPPNGLQRVDDILNQVKQYFHDCS